VPFDDSLAERQSEPGSSVFVTAAVESLEDLEHPVLVVGIDSDSLVAN